MKHPGMPILWSLREDAESAYVFNEILARNGSFGVKNTGELQKAQLELSNDRRVFSIEILVPPGFPAPILAMPTRGFAPDYFSFGPFYFCSHRFRDALAQPLEMVQYVPINLLSGGKDVQAQDYEWIRIIARQPAMDLQRSECKVENLVNRFTGAPYKRVGLVERCVLLEHLRPKTEIFRMEESPTDILVTDALALRVLQVGCTGMEFQDPGNEQWRASTHRYRTANGIETRRYGY